MDRGMRVLLGLVNYGSQAGLISQELQNRGYIAESVTYADVYGRVTDKEIQIPPKGRTLKRVIYELSFFVYKLRLFRKYNVFHFFFGKSLLPYNIDLPLYRFFGKKVIFEYLGNDCQLYSVSVMKYEFTNMRAMFSDNEGYRLDKIIKRRIRWNNLWADRNFVCAPIYSEFVPNSTVLPLMVKGSENLGSYSPPKDFTVLHAPTDRDFKGTTYLVSAVENLRSQGLKIRLRIIEGVSHEILQNSYSECTVFVDQLLAGWYGTAAIEAMGKGVPTICFLRHSYMEVFKRQFPDELVPIIGADPSNIEEILRGLLERDTEYFSEVSTASLNYVSRVHSLSNGVNNLIGVY